VDQVKKQRWVGSIVLIALAVILIPMILDFSNSDIDIAQGIRAPDAPDVNKMQVLPLEVWSQKRDPQVTAAPVYVEPEIDVDTDKQTKPESETTDVVVSVNAKEGKHLAADGSETNIKIAESVVDTEAAQQAKLDETLVGRAWMVQMVSVSKRENALAFRKKLEDLGYTAYVSERRRQDGSLLYRVRVGPELLRSKVNELQKRLKTETGIEGLVMRYQNP